MFRTESGFEQKKFSRKGQYKEDKFSQNVAMRNSYKFSYLGTIIFVELKLNFAKVVGPAIADYSVLIEEGFN